MQPNQPISSLGGEVASWPARAPTYHPFGVRFEAGNLISQTFTIWRDDARRLLGITAIPYLLLMAASFIGFMGLFAMIGFGELSDLWAASNRYAVPLAASAAGFVVLGVVVYTAAQVGTYVAVEESVRGEARRVGVATVLATGLSALPSVLGVYFVGIVLGATIMAPAVILGTVAAFSESIGLGVCAALLMIPTGLALFILGLRVIALAPVVAVIEEVGAIKAMRRAIELTRGNGVDLFVAGLVMMVVGFAIHFGFGMLGMIPFVGIFVSIVGGIFVSSLVSVWLFLVYAGLRDRAGA